MKALVNTAPLQMMYRDEPEALRLADDEVTLRIDAVGGQVLLGQRYVLNRRHLDVGLQRADPVD